MSSGPSPSGIAELRSAAAALARPKPPPKPRPWFSRWMTKRRVACVLAADLVIGAVGWHYLTAAHPSAVAAAVQRTANDAAHNNWQAVYGDLCSSDRAQTTEPALAEAGHLALLRIGELDHVTVTTVRSVHVSVGPLSWPAAQVSGEIVPVIGKPSAYTLTVVRELGGWRPCMSAGGYSSAGLGINVPLG